MYSASFASSWFVHLPLKHGLVAKEWLLRSATRSMLEVSLQVPVEPLVPLV